MKKELNKKSDEVTVIVEVTLKGKIEDVKKYIRDEQCPLFFNLNDDNTDIRYNSFHGGLPPNVGEKWMCNKWIRLKPIK